MFHKMNYRLALDLGSTSLGWCMVRLDKEGKPCAVIKAGVRIFSSGLDPEKGTSLAVARRQARGMRRRRDRLLKRKVRMMRMLIQYGFFPENEAERKALEKLNPYALRAKGLDEALAPSEFGRALFHMNQRRGFKSNRKTDDKKNDGSVIKAAISNAREAMERENCRTVGEWLLRRDEQGQTVRARYREQPVMRDGKSRKDKSYDLYIDRAMIEAEFDALWAKQAEFNPGQFTEQARQDLRGTLLYQRDLKPVDPGRCTFLPNEKRAPLALPGAQRFRMYQEVNNLRILQDDLRELPLSPSQRDAVIEALEKNNKRTFAQIRTLLKLGGASKFNLEDPKRTELKGNATSAVLGKAEYFGNSWFQLDEAKQDAIVMQLLGEENEADLIGWLQEGTGVDASHAKAIVNVSLPEGYSNLGMTALNRILTELKKNVVVYSDAVRHASFNHHSNIDASATGEIWPELPYYGLALQRHVGFGTNNPADPDEKRYGRIANPVVHIGLNQIRVVVNALIKRYGHPTEIIVELARELKQSKEKRDAQNREQATRQNKNKERRKAIADILGNSEDSVGDSDLQKWILWEELNPADCAERLCPYSGERIGADRLFSPEVEIEHILPLARTLDNSLNNKTVSMWKANRIKGNQTPWEAFGDSPGGFDYDAILLRAGLMPKEKRYRFGEDGYARWLKEDKDFLARALNDTRYMSRIAREYLGLINPSGVRVITGTMTAMLRRHFGLNNLLGLQGEKNRNDHRHHAVDACVIAVTDQSMLQKFATASANAREEQLGRLVKGLEMPWKSYSDHVKRAINHIKVSYRPDHNYEGAMHRAGAYGLRANGNVSFRKIVDGRRQRMEENRKVIPVTSLKASARHGLLPDGSPRPYKGYDGNSNYCIEIVRNEKGKWTGEVVSTFEAYQVAKKYRKERLRHRTLSISGKPLIMRLMRNDCLQFENNGELQIMRVVSIRTDGAITFAAPVEANVDARNRDKEDPFSYFRKTAGTLQQAKARLVTVSPIGELRIYPFKG
ncbi:MAG: type II CRISPR RNA-guided endonuclease Cas9 [Betaproteobacteria bacterium]|nr:type II CRISPR RNA-guided endonuclease Cas9 [Betaproteobacteria bacterium]